MKITKAIKLESKERLTFLKAFLHSLGLKYKDVTEVTSFSSLNTCFDKDDIEVCGQYLKMKISGRPFL